jgi:hypothetical protein
MQRSLFLGLALVACAALFSAGCISSPGTQAAPVPAAPALAANVSLAPLALAPADVPSGYTLLSGRQKSAGEMGTLAKDLGWQQGYVTVYSLNDTAGPSAITQTITVYAGKNMSDLVSLVDTGERQEKGLNFTDLPLPATGPDTRAFAATAANTTPSSTATGGMLLAAGTSAPAEGYAEVIFVKGDILEVIRMTGPGAQNDVLTTLAETAYAKLG